MKTSIISGITGQDGSYLAELLLSLDHKVIGLKRRSSSPNIHNISHLLHNNNFSLIEYDLNDPSGISSVIDQFKPDEFYNLAAQSHVGTSFNQPYVTFETNTLGLITVLDSIRYFSPSTKLYQASTSEMFGRNYTLKNNIKFQDENTPMMPQSPYGVSKLASHHLIEIYRKSYNLFVCSGILFNHESPRRGENFLTRKVTKYIAKLVKNKIDTKLSLGNLDSYRDWGHAKDYVKAMYLMMQHNQPEDFVISTGDTHSVREFVEKAFAKYELNYNDHIIIDPSLYRPAEVDYLRGDSTKARKILNWNNTISFEELIDDMLTSDLNNV